MKLKKQKLNKSLIIIQMIKTKKQIKKINFFKKIFKLKFSIQKHKIRLSIPLKMYKRIKNFKVLIIQIKD